MTKNYLAIVSVAKIAARDILRMRKINKWMTNKDIAQTDLNRYIKTRDESLATQEKHVATIEFEANTLPKNHPQKEDRMKEAQKIREDHENYIKNTIEPETKKTTERCENQMKEAQEAIDEWTNGKRKVSREDLANLVNTLIKENVSKQFIETNPITETE